MLLLNVLGVSLTHGLYTESKTFLRLFLTTLLRPPRHGVPPPIAHPMHPSYLVELCNEWIRLAPEPWAGPFTHRSFAAVTLEVLVEHGTATTWTCKSITRLVQLLRTRDFGCFLTFLHGLIEFLAARPRYLVHGCEDEYSLLARLAKWTGVITSDFFSVGDAEHSLYSIIEILASAHDAALHLSAIDNDRDDDRDARDPQAALVCTATHCLSAPLFATLSAPHRDAVLALLRDVAPSPATYSALAAQPLASLRTMAWALRAHDLCELEQTLWTSAVEHASGADPALRAALVDAAERGRRAIVPAGRGQMRTRRTASARSPPRKRARREAASWQWRRSRSPSSTSTSGSGASTPSLLSAGPSSSSSSSSLSSTRSRSRSPVPGDMAGASGDGETARRSRSTRRSCADLKSVLADALKTRKDLKAERRRASLRNVRSFGRSVSSERGYSSKEEAAAPALPSEGDVLDMFAYDDPF
ncbi:hypothetical protein BC826DRAFT_1049004 [Russula brevipes]|nr:hypothetical protein BC826DRAFT_1049004 [Russula brevipes]